MFSFLSKLLRFGVSISSSLLILTGLATASVAQTRAEKPAWLEIKIPVELQNDYDYASDTPGNERNNLFVSIEPEATFHVLPVPGLSVFAHGVLEQVADASPNEDRYFEDQGFFIEDLFLRYETGRFVFRGGKMNPGFGMAWDTAPGIYGTDMAEDYEVSERIALSGTVNADLEKLGKHAVTAGTFFLDTSPLQNTIVSKSRGTLGRSDGGVSNTGDFSSFNVAVDGGEFSGAPALQYHLGFVYQANGVDTAQNEKGYAAGLSNRFDLGGDMALTPLIEVVRLDDQGGTANKDRTYATLSFLGEWKSWNVALATTRRRTKEAGAATVSDYQYQASLGYAFESGLTADFGWKRLKESGAITDRIGLLFTYEFGFRR